MASRCHNSAIVGAILQCAYEELGISPQTLYPVPDLQALADRARVTHTKWSDRVIHNVEDDRSRLGEWYNKVRANLELYVGKPLPHIVADTPTYTDIPNIRKVMVALAGQLKKIPTFIACDNLPADTQHLVAEDLKKNFKDLGYKPNYVYLLDDIIAGYIFIGYTKFGTTMLFTSKCNEVEPVTEHYVLKFINEEIRKAREGVEEEN